MGSWLRTPSCAAAVLLAALITGVASPAMANNACEAGVYHWTNLNASMPVWDGIDAEISTSGMYLPVGAADSHLLEYVDQVTEQNGTLCPGVTPEACQIQGGWQVGRVSSSIVSSPTLYVEKQDVNGYITLAYSSVNIGTSTRYRAQWDGTTTVINGRTVGHFAVAYDNHVGNGWQRFGDAYLPWYAAAWFQASTEAVNDVHGYCPVLNPYSYFGNLNGGNHVRVSATGQSYGYNDVTNSEATYSVDAFYPAYELTVGVPSQWKVTGN